MDPASPQRDALPRAPTLDLTLPEVLDGLRQQEDSEESDTEERDFFGESVKEDSIKQDQEEEKFSDIKAEVRKDSVEETWTTWTRKEGGSVGKELDKGCLDYLDLDLGPLGYLDLDLEPKDIEERTSRVMVKLEEIAEFLLYFDP